MVTRSTPDSTTARALLGLLSLRPWTAYELTQQMQRALRWAWPRSEAGVYAEIKKLVPAGLAVAVEEEVGNRTRTRYEITDEGRAAVRQWLHTEPSPPRFELEVLLRLFLADLGDPDDLRRSLDATRRQVAEMLEQLGLIVEQYAGDDAPFPERAHLNVLFMHHSTTQLVQLLDWCDDVETELDDWPSTAHVGMTRRTRTMLERTAARHRALVDRVAEHPEEES